MKLGGNIRCWRTGDAKPIISARHILPFYLGNEEYKFENILYFLWLTGFFYCSAPVLQRMYINFRSGMPSELMIAYSFLVRLKMVSGPNPHMNVNRGVASPNPFGEGGGGGVGYFYRNNSQLSNKFFSLKTPSYRVAKAVERGGGWWVWHVFFR